MDNKNEIIPNEQNNQINSISFQNNYNLSFPNQILVPSENELHKNSENQNDSSTQNKVENEKEIETGVVKKVRKRATKKESDIRNYKCEFCDKSYLSYPALYTHCKQKHNTNNHSGRGRGRPKKEQTSPNSEKNKYDPLTCAYFQKEERAGTTKVENINECVKNSFNYLYLNNENEENKDLFKLKFSKRKMKIYTKIEDHPFLGKFLNDAHDINSTNEDEKTPTDIVLMDYLNKMSIYCNEKYYEKLIVFVTLFREHINITNKDKMKDNQEFTEVNEAEDAPESSNEFITDFLFPENNENEFGLGKEEAIDLTRNLCNWMYLSNYTCSKLFLLDK